MKQKIGMLIKEVDIRNTSGEDLTLFGVSISKEFIKSVANVIGTDLRKYKVVAKNQFVCSLMQVSRDEKIPIALWGKDKSIIVSPAYKVFQVTDENIILPEYLALWFKREEFDREASYYGVGGVRGSLEWEDFCDLTVPVPSIAEQREIVDAYNDIERRIALKRKINDNLESQALTLFKHSYEEFDESELVSGTVSDFGEFIRGKNLTAAEMRSGSIPVISAGIEPSGFHNEYNVSSPSITISGSGVNAGYVSYHAENIWASDCSYNNTAKLIRCLYLLLKINQSQISDMQKGTAQPHVYPKEVNPLEIKYPPFETLDKLESKLIPIFDNIYNSLIEIQSLQEAKKVFLTTISSR